MSDFVRSKLTHFFACNQDVENYCLCLTIECEKCNILAKVLCEENRTFFKCESCGYEWDVIIPDTETLKQVKKK